MSGEGVLDADLEGCASALWLLTRPDCRALRSVARCSTSWGGMCDWEMSEG
ncbi:lysR family transcriptional regulator domain protein [Pseudomonas paraeruginosa]|uniref:LysR family transcriptional regulator domain protein n=1 Tax=Pseudomonas paraeruginosa TaxID=2994495 RepID=A0A2R3J4I2_9PSED|nr:lysR family transcriptional regulator domain protein [Pseudomonas paraeruginosa]AWE92073.1 lysR family transcriptional regulator domain protein [Pseudomonas paraeruginosa]